MEKFFKVITIICMVVVVSSVHGLISAFVGIPFLGLLALLVAVWFGYQIWTEFSFTRFLGWFAGVIVFSIF